MNEELQAFHHTHTWGLFFCHPVPNR